MNDFLSNVQRQLDPDDFRIFLALAQHAQTHTPEPDGSYFIDLDYLARRAGVNASAPEIAAALVRLRDTPLTIDEP